MHLELRPAAKEDAHEAAALIAASFKDNPFRAIITPNGVSPAAFDKIVASAQKAVDDPDKYALKVVDTDNNDRMAGCAVWAHTKARTDEDWDRAREEAPSAFADARMDILEPFLGKDHDAQRRIKGHARWWELESLNTLPDYERLGVGSTLMKWGLDKLEEIKVPGFLVATARGHPFYLKHGFQEVERWETDLSQWPPAHGMYRNVFMTRMPLGYAASSSQGESMGEVGGGSIMSATMGG